MEIIEFRGKSIENGFSVKQFIGTKSDSDQME